jgi:hypothetical protein
MKKLGADRRGRYVNTDKITRIFPTTVRTMIRESVTAVTAAYKNT